MTYQEEIETLQSAFTKYIAPACKADIYLTEQEANSLRSVAPASVCIQAMERYAKWLRKKREAGIVLKKEQIKGGIRTSCARFLLKLQERKGLHTDFVSSIVLPPEPKVSQPSTIQRVTPEATAETVTKLRELFQCECTDHTWTLRDSEVEELIKRSTVKVVRQAIQTLSTKYSTDDYELAMQALSDRVDALLWEREALAFA